MKMRCRFWRSTTACLALLALLWTVTKYFPFPVRPVQTLKFLGLKGEEISDGAILQDLVRCSTELGMTEHSLLKNKEGIAEVSRKAEVFLEQIQQILPPGSFSRRWKNPCWVAPLHWNESLIADFQMASNSSGNHFKKLLQMLADKDHSKNSKSLLCLPYFFLAGFPKSATTTIHNALRRHPEIVGPLWKEPHWWTRALHLSKSREFDVAHIPASFMLYTMFFKEISSQLSNRVDLITYDGSQSTLWDSNFYHMGQSYCAMPAVISRVLPNAKFIVAMRNPVKRLYSHFLYSCQLQYGEVQNWPAAIRENGAGIFHAQVLEETERFHSCVRNMSVVECVDMAIFARESAAAYKCGTLNQRLVIGMYAVHIKKWLQFYPRENFLFIRMEDISREPVKTMLSITNFLGISPMMGGDVFGRAQNVLQESARVAPMEEKTERLLQEFYQPYNEELVNLGL